MKLASGFGGVPPLQFLSLDRVDVGAKLLTLDPKRSLLLKPLELFGLLSAPLLKLMPPPL